MGNEAFLTAYTGVSPQGILRIDVGVFNSVRNKVQIRTHEYFITSFVLSLIIFLLLNLVENGFQIEENFETLETTAGLALAGPNARPRGGAPLSSGVITSSCSVNSAMT